MTTHKNVIHDNDIAMQLYTDCVGKDKFLITRIGGVEFNAYINFKINNEKKIDGIHKKNLYTYCGYYDKLDQHNIIKKYFDHFENFYKSCDLVMIANALLYSYYGFIQEGQPGYSAHFSKNKDFLNFIDKDLLNINNKMKISYGVMENFTYFKDYFSLLDGKKILIISPFEKEIKEQLMKKNNLFVNKNNIADFTNFKYPDFKSVAYINTFLTTNNYETPHNNILETFEYYKKELINKDFDVALLICGAYTYLFGDYIYNTLNKSCIHVGGIGQLFFGIKGGRFLSPYYEQLMNDNWIYPKRVIDKNAPGVPIFDGLLGYYNRK